ncbi:MAG: D-alanyl-D-alanine carboxypeptidase/D-alanyl-D-alanine-endopeptidase [Bacteroidaceae bacterium]|nr:D-alanyl-D-alanine carboxypeptidase/D-alanyl-D-alanine-endopeptidase [Bacteroidaceae bacterium]
MKKMIRLLSCRCVLLLTVVLMPSAQRAQTVTPQWGEALAFSLDSLLEAPMFQRSQVAILVYDLDGDSVVYDRGARQLMRPASVMKVLTATTALTELGADYSFRTTLAYDGIIEPDTLLSDSLHEWQVLRGDVYIKGGFDPLFNEDDMEAFVQSLRDRGIRCIDGRVYADLSFKDTLKWGEGWCWDDKEATLTPLLYKAKDVFMPRFLQALDADSIVRPAGYGRITGGSTADLSVLCERTHTIADMLTRMMKESDNLYAESLFYQLSAARQRATARLSAEREYALMRQIGLNPDAYTVADGSGLSLYNYLTPQLVVKLLRYVWTSPTIMATLYPVLPVAGVDGTLKKRMKGTRAEGNVHAKTGTLSKVSTLAGYATAGNGTHLAFCIFNQGVLNSQEGRDFQDRVCLQLVK